MAKTAIDTQGMTRSGLNLIKQALSIYDGELNLVVCNRPFKNMFGLPDRLTEPGASFSDTIRFLATSGEYGEISDVESFVRERVDQAKTFTPHYFERDRSNGTTISVEGSPLRQGGWVTVYTDITDIKMSEAMLRHRSEGLSEELLARSEELAKINRNLRSSITALEEAKEELAESEARLNLTNAMMPAHIARVGLDGCYTYSNLKLDQVLPDANKNILGMHMSEALGQDAFGKILPNFKRALMGDSSTFEFSLDETDRTIRVAFTPDFDQSGEITGVYLLSTNVTDERNARRALMHTRRRELAAQLTSGLAHDFSNLLTVILGQLGRIEEGAAQDSELFGSVQTMRNAAMRGSDLIKGLSRLEEARNLRVGPVPMDQFAQELKRLCRAAIGEAVELGVENALGNTRLIFDAAFAQDAILNLALNASEAMDAKGRLKITLAQQGEGWFQIRVADSGPGFEADALEHGVQPFYTTKRGGAGRGLGLSTVFDFAQSSGGTMRLANAHDGGAVITVRIPFYRANSTGPQMVLLVEDNPDIRAQIRSDLLKLGHKVLESDSAEEAQGLSQIEELGVVVTDLMLAGEKTGFDLATSIQENRPELPIIMITALPKEHALRKAATAKFPICQKPFKDNELMKFFESNM